MKAATLLPSCLPPCLPPCLPACLPASLPPCLPCRRRVDDRSTTGRRRRDEIETRSRRGRRRRAGPRRRALRLLLGCMIRAHSGSSAGQAAGPARPRRHQAAGPARSSPRGHALDLEAPPREGISFGSVLELRDVVVGRQYPVNSVDMLQQARERGHETLDDDNAMVLSTTLDTLNWKVHFRFEGRPAGAHLSSWPLQRSLRVAPAVAQSRSGLAWLGGWPLGRVAHVEPSIRARF